VGLASRRGPDISRPASRLLRRPIVAAIAALACGAGLTHAGPAAAGQPAFIAVNQPLPEFTGARGQWKPNADFAEGMMLASILAVSAFFYRGWRRHSAAALRAATAASAGSEPPHQDFRVILDALPAMVAYWDRDLVNRYTNRAHEVWFGLERGALLGRHLRALLSEDLLQRDLPHIEAVLRGEVQKFEQSAASPDGSGYRHLLIHYLPDIDHGHVLGFYVLINDISELANSRMALAGARRENDELIRTLDMHSKVSMTDEKGYITYVNENFCRILGYSRDEVLGRPHSIINSGVQTRKFWADMWDTIANGRPWRGEICNRGKDGALHWVDSIIAPFHGRDGRVQRYVSIGTNISAAKSTEQRLRYNEAFLDRIGAVAGIGGWEFDVRTGSVSWSAQMYRIHEVDIEYQTNAESKVVFYTSEARPIMAAAILDCAERGIAWDLELPAVTAKGRAIWLRTVGAPELEGNRVVRLTGALQDVTARKTAEKQLLESSARFALAADSARIGVWDFDLTDDRATWDDWMYRMYGIQKTGEFENLASWAEALHPDDRQRCVAEVNAAIRGPTEFSSEFRIIRPGGEVRHIKADSRTVRGADGCALRMAGVNFDVTDARRSEMVARRETASLLRTVLDAASEVSIIATDENLVIRVFNAGAERMLGYASSEVVGTETLARIHDPAEIESYSQRLGAQTGRRIDALSSIVEPSALRQPLERTYVRKNGSRITVSLFISAMRSDDGDIRGYVCVAHDITQQNENQNALLDATAKAENANNAKSLFLANMSHEIRTPMSAVIGLSYLLMHTSLDAEQSGLLAKIQIASNSLLGLITNILDLSKIEAHELLVESIAFSLPDLLRDVAAVMAVHADAKAIDFSMDTPSGLPEALTGDPTRLKQILTNLLSNAIRFTHKGSVRFSMGVRADTASEVILSFAVTDTGIGIAPENQETLFDPFAQADASTTRRYGGTGLGLSIVKQLSELLGGTVELRSAVGIGSTFTVVLPFMRASQYALDAARVETMAHKQGALVGTRALVVDDSDINLEVAKRILELDGVLVSLANNGQQALDRLRASPDAFDVVLMDVQMPILDGYEATRRIRSVLGLAELPIIAVTASALSSERQRAEAAGMNGFICKPFDGPSLARSILRHIRPADTRHAAPNAPIEAAAPAAPWPVIAGIDTADACARWCGDAQLFLRMLARLFDEFEQIDFPFGVHDSQAIAPFVRRMHKLRGGACMLGASTVYLLAGQVEAACINGEMGHASQLTAKLTGEMQRLSMNARPMMSAIRVQADQTSMPGGVDIDPRHIDDLRALLRQQSLVAVDRFKSLSPQLRQFMGKESYERMSVHIDNLRFEDASKVLLDCALRGDAAAVRPLSGLTEAAN
jgi:PAS domain S-box-containing protein